MNLDHARIAGPLLAVLPALALTVFLSGCSSAGAGGAVIGTGTGTTPPPPVNNVQPVTVDAGPFVNGQQIGDNDLLFTTVTICVPGTAVCQSIDHVQVDTGSTGLRLFASQLTLALPLSRDASNNPIGSCAQYADSSYQWGAVENADILLAGEVASSVPIQVIAPGSFPAVPTSCSNGGTPAQTVTDLGANGILGVGLFRQDCGAACASVGAPTGFYYDCPTTGCTVTSVALTQQLQNPVWLFAADNNGLSITLPQIGATGATTVSGSMIFGIGTQANNALNGVRAQAANAQGYISTTFNGQAYPTSFIDSGSNGIFFLDSTTTGMPLCNAGQAPGFYCPANPTTFTAITTGPNPNGTQPAISSNIVFSIANAITLLNSPATAFNNLGGDDAGLFDFGLPFFFGRTVFVGIELQNSPAGTGPYWAY